MTELEITTPFVPLSRRVLELSRLLLILLGVQIGGLLVFAAFVREWLCVGAAAFLGFGLLLNVAIFAARCRYYITRARLRGEALNLEFYEKNEKVEQTLPLSMISVKLDRAMQRGPKSLYIELRDLDGKLLLRQHKLGGWSNARLSELFRALKAASGEQPTHAEEQLLDERR